MEKYPPKNWQNQRGCVWGGLWATGGCVAKLYRGSATTCPYAALLKSLAYCFDTWCGLERQRKSFSGIQDSHFLGGRETVFWEFSVLSWRTKDGFLTPYFDQELYTKEATQCDGNITAAHSQKTRNRDPAKAPMLPFRSLYTISFIFLNIHSKFQSPKLKSYMKLCFSEHVP